MPGAWRSSALVLVLLFSGCQRTEDTPATPAAAPAPAAAASPTTQQPKAGDTIDVHGIVVKFLADGVVEIRGRDRWNNALDATYENVGYLRNALPVLARSITAEQAAGLRALVGG